MKLRILGLDLATASAGVAWSCDHHGRYTIGCRTVHTRRTVPKGVDHKRMRTVLEDVAAAARCGPHLVVIEGTFTRGGHADVPLIGLRAVVTHWLWVKGIPYVDVAPKTLKVWATGRGNADKTAVREAVTALYGEFCHIDSADAADAMALLTMGLARYGQPLADVPFHHRRALDVPRWPNLSWDAPTFGADSSSAGRRGQTAGTR